MGTDIEIELDIRASPGAGAAAALQRHFQQPKEEGPQLHIGSTQARPPCLHHAKPREHALLALVGSPSTRHSRKAHG